MISFFLEGRCLGEIYGIVAYRIERRSVSCGHRGGLLMTSVEVLDGGW